MPKRKLTKKQERQIAHNQRRLISEEHPENNDLSTAHPGTIISHFGRQLAVEDENNKVYQCKLRQNLGNIACGDRVLFQIDESSEADAGIVVAIIDRKNLMEKTGFGGKAKPIAANIDKVFITCSVSPPPNHYLIDRYIVACENLAAEAVLVINKIDRIDASNEAAIEQLRSTYSGLGYEVIMTCAKTGQGMDALRTALAGVTSIFVGLSGVGKSSLAQLLLPDTDIRIGDTSEATGEGKHTTTVSSLYHLGNDANIIDSPGVRDFTPTNTTKQEVENGFTELKDVIGRCKFSNCRHLDEPGCAVNVAAEEGIISEIRLESFRKMLRDIDN